MTSAMPMQCSTNWAIKQAGSWSYCEVSDCPVALPHLYFYWSLYPVAAIFLSGGFIVSILLPIVSFSNHRPRLER